MVDLDSTPTVRQAFIDAGPDTPFEIGSVTKGLTGLLLAQAIERGDVGLDTVLSALLPETSGSPAGRVSLRELATHTSGLPRLPTTPATALRLLASGCLGFDPYRGTTPASVIRGAPQARLSGRGEQRYSNWGAALLGHGLARAAGLDFEALLAERVFVPLNMTGAGTNPGDALPRGFTASGRRAWPWRAGGYGPAGSGIVCTATDLGRLLVALLDGAAPGQSAILPIIPSAPGTPNRFSGMFWVIDRDPGSGRTMVWHNGQTGGYSSFLAVYPQARRGVAVLADTADAHAQERVALGLSRWLINRSQRNNDEFPGPPD